MHVCIDHVTFQLYSHPPLICTFALTMLHFSYTLIHFLYARLYWPCYISVILSSTSYMHICIDHVTFQLYSHPLLICTFALTMLHFSYTLIHFLYARLHWPCYISVILSSTSYMHVCIDHVTFQLYSHPLLICTFALTMLHFSYTLIHFLYARLHWPCYISVILSSTSYMHVCIDHVTFQLYSHPLLICTFALTMLHFSYTLIHFLYARLHWPCYISVILSSTSYMHVCIDHVTFQLYPKLEIPWWDFHQPLMWNIFRAKSIRLEYVFLWTVRCKSTH